MEEERLKVSPGDLLEIVAYDCEGVVQPWGFRSEVLEGVSAISGGHFRRIVRSPKNFVQLTHGETCIAVSVAAVLHPTIDSYCVVLVRGSKLGIHLRFLKKISIQ